MSEQPKKVYTLEENIKYISFGLKDLTKAIQELTQTIRGSKGDRNEEPSTW